LTNCASCTSYAAGAEAIEARSPSERALSLFRAFGILTLFTLLNTTFSLPDDLEGLKGGFDGVREEELRSAL
jgi:hypothetical protein